jgi:hypothetical protein
MIAAYSADWRTLLDQLRTGDRLPMSKRLPASCCCWMTVVVTATIVVTGFAGTGLGQQAQVTLPSHRLNEGFFERIGVGWHFESTRPNSRMFFNYPGLNSAVPFFGGWDPATDARFGFAGRRGNTRFGFNMALQQGSSRTMIGSASSVMVPNGGSGSISSTTLRPFVTGWIPVVGQQFRPPLLLPPAWQSRTAELSRSPVGRKKPRILKSVDDAPLRISNREPRTNSSITTATRGDESVAEIRRNQLLQDQARLQEVEELVERARGAEQAGKLGVARIYYQQAANRSTGELRTLLLERQEELKRRKAAFQQPAAEPVDEPGSN